MDFISDQLINGQRIYALTVFEVFTQEALTVTVGWSWRANQVVDV